MPIQIENLGQGKFGARLLFGGGISPAVNPRDLLDREAADGENFDIKLDGGKLARRKPFDTIATAPNGKAIRGGAELQKVDGSLSALIQAGSKVYRWEGDSVDANAVDNAGTAYLTRGAAPTGIANGKKGTVAGWFRVDGGDGSQRLLVAAGPSAPHEFMVLFNASNQLEILGLNAALATILRLTSTTTYAASSAWHWFAASWDLAENKNLSRLYVDDADETTYTVFTDDTIVYNQPDWAVGAGAAGGSIFDGAFGEIYINTAEYVDLRDTTIRRKIASSSSTPANLGPDGSRLTGNQPLAYFNGDATDFHVNRGSDSAAWTVTGTLTDASSNPGTKSFTEVGEVPQDSELRGGRDSTSELDDLVIITDLARLATVKTWNGTAFADLAHNLSAPLRAKYALVRNERLLLFNVQSEAATPHVVLGSGISAITMLTTTAAIGAGSAADPFFLPMPDLKAINGAVDAFGLIAVSTENGRFWKLAGTSANDFAFLPLYADSGAQGSQSISYIGNDVIYGREGRIESLIGADTFGDVEADDVSRPITPIVEDVSGWRTVYNPRLHRAYFWPRDKDFLLTFHKSLYDPLRRSGRDVAGYSPWVKWTTTHGEENFQTTGAFLLRNPQTGLDQVYFGEPDGTIHQLEGDGTQDGGDSNVLFEWLSPLIQPDGDFAMKEVRGYVLYESFLSSTLAIKAEWQGERRANDTATVAIPVDAGATYFGGDVYFGGDFYWGIPDERELAREYFSLEGTGSALQLRVSNTGSNPLFVREIGIKFTGHPITS